MVACSSFALLILVSCVVFSNCFVFQGLTCQVSEWGPWSASFGFGTSTRTRDILRYPSPGQPPCPPLTEEKSLNDLPSLDSTAYNMVHGFMKRDEIGPAVSYTLQSSVDGSARTVTGGTGKLRDLLLIVDSSGSITRNRFNIAKDQLARMMGLLCPTPDPFNDNRQQAALIQYSSQVVDVFDFNDKSSTAEIQRAIKNMKYYGHTTCTADAFNQAKNMFSKARGMRTESNVKKEVLIISDGKPFCRGSRASAETAAMELKATANVKVFGLMIGIHSDDGKAELSKYVSTPINEHLFAIKNYQDLDKLLNLIEGYLPSFPCAPFDLTNTV